MEDKHHPEHHDVHEPHNDHEHDHDHSHAHGHNHIHAHNTSGNLQTAFFLNLGFAGIEIVGGLWTGSLAILSDAVHDLGDSFSLGVSWYLQHIASREGDNRYSYGYRRFSLLGALLNLLVLIGGSVFVLVNAIPDLANPTPPKADGMLALAILGVVVNGAAVLKLRGESGLNARTAMIHLMEDAIGWIAVLVVSIILLIWDIPILDPILSLGITAWVLYNVYLALRKTGQLFLQGVPDEIDIEELENELRAIPSVEDVHHTHVWSLDGEQNVFTTHLVVDPHIRRQQMVDVKCDARDIAQEHGFSHATVEIEFVGETCSMSHSAVRPDLGDD